ncbi:hypothetical protein K0040_08450 [Terrisporobacter petrolearius]|uniref:hypothetical protein n=1 Tax=Terrisporobacter petrolearius TaxID=1460447 RepID=UPI001D164BA1|nr:hypothetical protein [Terrisporobacter petrolearius]MCC3864346.1 hypothetical protein [Terrisporobacter petrolearius]
MARKRRIKKSVFLVAAIILFFGVYIISFTLFSNKDNSSKDNAVKIEEPEDNRSLLKQLEEKDKIYLSDGTVSDVRVDEQLLEELRYSFEDISKIRKPASYESTYEGYSDDGLKFSTNLDIIRIYTVNKEEYYKIPVASKDELKKILDKSIYTSFDFIKQYKTWKEVKITYKDTAKNLSKWKYDDLANTMAAKRVVGKVQPEKSKERSKYNFRIEIKADNYEARVEVMGANYVQIESKGLNSYYEVHTALYDYIKDEVFQLSK